MKDKESLVSALRYFLVMGGNPLNIILFIYCSFILGVSTSGNSNWFVFYLTLSPILGLVQIAFFYGFCRFFKKIEFKEFIKSMIGNEYSGLSAINIAAMLFAFSAPAGGGGFLLIFSLGISSMFYVFYLCKTIIRVMLPNKDKAISALCLFGFLASIVVCLAIYFTSFG